MEKKIRKPGDFIITKGVGESDLTIHAGSYHMALYEAKISNYNIFTYSSVIPATSRQVTFDDIDMPDFGSEMPVIMARADGFKDEHISAGIIYSWLYKDNSCEEKIGGLVCELSGYIDTESLERKLKEIHKELYEKTYSEFYMGEQNIITNSLTIEKRYGTCLVAIIFINENGE